jgi:Zn-dependent peptidase ImmA (M78 family)
MTLEIPSPSACGIQLAKLWTLAGKSLPVDVKELALEYSSKKPDPITKVEGHAVAGIEGMLIQRSEKKCWYILYQKDIAVSGRINFTLAHELGHYVLHRTYQDQFECDQKKLLAYSDSASLRYEAEANKFASYLLMPIADFRTQVNGEFVSLDLLEHCADRYQVSFTAATLKWLEFTNEAAMVIVARDGFVCWSYASKSAWKLGVHVPHGKPIPEIGNSRPQIITGGSNKRYGVPSGVWHPTLDAVESVIVSDKFDLTIFLIQFPEANLITHKEVEEDDSFDFLSARAKGLLWGK